MGFVSFFLLLLLLEVDDDDDEDGGVFLAKPFLACNLEDDGDDVMENVLLCRETVPEAPPIHARHLGKTRMGTSNETCRILCSNMVVV